MEIVLDVLYIYCVVLTYFAGVLCLILAAGIVVDVIERREEKRRVKVNEKRL